MVDLQTVTADIVDSDGNALVGVLAQVCGLDQCINGESNAGGHVVVNVGKTLKQPAFKYGDALAYARFALPLTDASPVLGAMVTVGLPAPGEKLDGPGDVSSGGVTLTLAANTAIDFPLEYDTEEKQTFRAASVPVDDAPAAVDPSLGFEIVYGVAPADTAFCPPVGVTVPNGPGWPPGTAVELWIHGLDVGEGWASYGGWAKVSDGEVSADGSTVRTSAGGGMSLLSTFAIRKK